MDIQVDTREKASEWQRIQSQFDSLGVGYFRSKLYVGDYMNIDNPRLVVDRKQNLLEVCSNVCQQHERFKAELVRAQEHGIKIILLIEQNLKSLEDVYFWRNPRIEKSPKATTGPALYRSLCTIRDRYGVQIEFCSIRNTGKKIVELLGGGNEAR